VTSLAVRGLAERKLRSVLTAIAVLLGVAMISGTYIETDQIRNAFTKITEQSVSKLDVIVTPKEEFTSDFGAEPPTLPDRLVRRVEEVPGVAAAEPELTAFGELVVDGDVVETHGAPALVNSVSSPRFDPTESVEGRDPTSPGEAAVLEQNAQNEGIEVGDRVGVVTRHGVQHVTVTGIFAFGEGGSSLGGATAIALMPQDVQRWFDLRGKLSSISIAADPGIDPTDLARNVRAVLPADARAQTASENAQESADEINDQIGGFLTPALLTLAGAAVLVGAFIIFNTFSITVAQRMREFAMLRALGATRRQVMGVVITEALLIGVTATAVGIAAGIAFAKLLNALFDAVGFGIPTSGLVIEPRTVIVSLLVGIGVTFLSALIPGLRATRVPPVAAMSGAPIAPSKRRRRLSAVIRVLCGLGGLALAAQGLFGSGPASARAGAVGLGAVLIFVGVALSARYVVRPVARVVGWPIERIFRTPGRLARENAERNPGRTAITSAALMVGLGLVVFVAVFAAGLKSSIGRQIDDLVKADIFIYSSDFEPFPRQTVKDTAQVNGVKAAVPTLFEQLEVNGEKSNSATDFLDGVRPSELSEVYSFDWIDGDDSLIGQLGGENVVVEEQFAKAHDIDVGDRYHVVTPSGGRAILRAIGIYRDPTILQGSIGTLGTMKAISPARDPVVVLVSLDDSADPTTVENHIKAALEKFPTAKVENRDEYQQTISDQLNQIIYLLYALLAMSIVISLFGIANSLFLSIHERTGELGVLRAVGATTTQVRRVIRYESVITSVIGGVLGTAIGVVFAVLLIESLSEFGFSVAIPGGQLAVFMLLSVLVGVVGAIGPARRASRINVLDAIRHE
jgi:putative ABC transport system permease protein